MRRLIAFSVVCLLLPSCGSSILSISAKDESNSALVGFPFKVDFGSGIHRAFGPVPADFDVSQQVIQQSESSYVVTTNSSGEAHVRYDFTERQPNRLMLLLGAEEVPNRNIEISPMKTLPKGCKITLTVPNP